MRAALWVLVAWVVAFWRLGYLSLLDPDEAHYAELTREMLRAHSWLVPLLDGAPFIDKPVLFHWLQGLSVAALGESALANRLPNALSALWSDCDRPVGRRAAVRPANRRHGPP